MENSKRQAIHQKKNEVERILQELTTLISDPIDRTFYSNHPILFIMGCARSGTTLVGQYLASTNAFCFPSNLISRFYYAPYIGSLVQKLLVDHDHKEELLGAFKNQIDFSSDLGKTKGILSPHEFWYYWRRFFPFGEIQKLSDKELSNIDIKGFVNGLKAIQEVFDKPLLLKGMIANWHIPFLASQIPNSYFLWVKRNTIPNAQSLLRTREAFFGNVSDWYSFKPVEYEQIKGRAPEEQVIAQVHYTNSAVEKGLGEIEPRRVIEIEYEQFCENPHELINLLKTRFDYSFHNDSKLEFRASEKHNADTSDLAALIKYKELYEGVK